MKIEFTNPERTEACSSSAANAATWWAGRLRDAAGVGDNGDDDRVRGAMTCGLTRMIRNRKPPTDRQCDAFEDTLRDWLTRVLIAQGAGHKDVHYYYDRSGFDDGGIDVSLSVDYHPCGPLMAALLTAGIDRGVAEIAALPLKTAMKVSMRRVLLKHGYGARFVEIHGPTWGSTYAEHRAAEDYRSDEFERLYESWDAAGRPGEWRSFEAWQGAVPANPTWTP